MKTKISKRIIISGFLYVLLVFLTSCESLVTPTLPDELLGSWTRHIGKSDTGCDITYTFRVHDYTYFEWCYYTGSTTYDEEIEEIYKDENMFRTPDNMHIAWHVDGTSLYLYKTNPGDPKPVLADDWWSGQTVWRKK